MTLLTRENLDDGTCRRGLGLPDHLAWSDARLAASLADTWACRPRAAVPGEGAAAPSDGPAAPDAAVWVFGYGSLIWNPLMPVTAQHNARLAGWRRSFCLGSISGRGNPQHPGRVLSLQPGGSVDGVVLGLPPAQALAELRRLWSREMISGAYRPAWLEVALHGGGSVQALTFTANPDHPLHAQDDAPATVARHVVAAHGAFGPNLDYLTDLVRALAARQLADAYVDAVVDAVKALDGR